MSDRWGGDNFEVGEYIASFKASSSRVRWVIFVITTASIMILLATWNTVEWSWAVRRESLWIAGEIAAAKRLVDAPLTESPARIEARELLKRLEKAERAGTKDQLLRDLVAEKARSDYVSHVADEYWLLHVPGVPVATDVNELGLLSGITLSLLMLLLLLALIRQHENIDLCSFKIVRLYERDGAKEHGESRANFLYHALAMSEVLGAPPTLARWHHRGVPRDYLAMFVVLIPTLIYGFVVWNNKRTIGVAQQAFGEIPRRFWAHFVFLAVILGLTGPCCLYLRSCHQRWRAIFYIINPGKAAAEPERNWLRWVKLSSSWNQGERELRRKIECDLANAEMAGRRTDPEVATVTTVHSFPRDSLVGAALRRVATQLMKSGRRAARYSCAKTSFRYLDLAEHKLRRRERGKLVDFEIEWRFRRR